MKTIITFTISLLFGAFSVAQTITFDDQSYTSGQSLGNPYSVTNNGETFVFSISGGGVTNHIYRTSEPSCGSTGIGHVYAGNITQTTWTIETQSGNEINLGTIKFDNVFSCFAFNYNLTLEGFKNNVSTGTQSHTVSGLNSVFASNASFDDVDKIVITSTDLAHLGIDDINWAMSTLNTSSFLLDDEVGLYQDMSDTITIIKPNSIQLQKYTIYSISGAKIATGKETVILINTLASGMYIIKLDFNKGTVVKKVVVQ